MRWPSVAQQGDGLRERLQRLVLGLDRGPRAKHRPNYVGCPNRLALVSPSVAMAAAFETFPRLARAGTTS